MLPILGFDALQLDDEIELSSIISGLKRKYPDLEISERLIKTFSEKGHFCLIHYLNLSPLLYSAEEYPMRPALGENVVSRSNYRMKKSEVLKLIAFIEGQSKSRNTVNEEPKIIKGEPATLEAWVLWYIESKGFNRNDELPLGFQRKLIEDALKRSEYKHDSVRNACAWDRLGLKSVHNTRSK